MSKTLDFTTFTMICKYFNLKPGCNKEGCLHPHVPYCTNEICINAMKQHTHTLETCGQKGGGGHAAFIEKKRAAAMAEKAKTKAAAVTEYGQPLYDQVLAVLTADDNLGYNEVIKLFPMELEPNRLAGKVVGMFLDGLNHNELDELATMAAELNVRMLEAIQLIHGEREKETE